MLADAAPCEEVAKRSREAFKEADFGIAPSYFVSLFGTLASAANLQEKSEKVPIFITGDETVVEIMAARVKTLKPLEVVGLKDDSRVAVLVDYTDRKETDPFVCMYMAHYNGPTFQTLLGGGVAVGKNC